MLQLHVVEPKNWLDYIPSWITAVAALITVVVAVVIARNQGRLQKTLAEKQFELQARQLEQQERLLRKDLFDKRFTVFTEVLVFLSYVLTNNGKIQLAGGEYRRFREAMDEAEMLFGDDVNKYLADVDETARQFYVSAYEMDKATAAGHSEAINRNGELLNRLSVTLPQQRKGLFRPYLSFSSQEAPGRGRNAIKPEAST